MASYIYFRSWGERLALRPGAVIRKSELALMLAAVFAAPVFAQSQRTGARPPVFQIVPISLNQALPERHWQQIITRIADYPVFGELICPHAVARDSQNRLLVADPCVRRVYAVDLAQRTFKYVQRPWRAFKAPVGLAVDNSDNVYVADAGAGKILVFDRTGNFQRSFGEGILSSPAGIAIDAAEGRIYIADSGNNHIYKADLDGNFVWGYEGPVKESVGFDRPSKIALSEHGLFVLNSGNGLVQVFNHDAHFRAQVRLPILNATGLAVDHDENLYIVDARQHTVLLLDSGRRQPFTIIKVRTPMYLVPDVRCESNLWLYAAEVNTGLADTLQVR